MKKPNKLTRICNFTCAILMVALVVMQFMPFWYSVNGRHMTPADYATFDPAKETVAAKPIGPTRPRLNVKATTAPTEAATEAATEATTAATEATTAATEATTAATEATAAATEATAAATEATAAPTEAATTPEPTIKDISIARVVWWPEKEKGAPVLMFHAVILLLGAVGIFFCLAKNDKTLNFVWTLALSIIATRGYLVNPGAQTGRLWFIHLGLAIALALPSLFLMYQWVRSAIRWFTVKE